MTLGCIGKSVSPYLERRGTGGGGLKATPCRQKKMERGGNRPTEIKKECELGEGKKEESPLAEIDRRQNEHSVLFRNIGRKSEPVRKTQKGCRGITKRAIHQNTNNALGGIQSRIKMSNSDGKNRKGGLPNSSSSLDWIT